MILSIFRILFTALWDAKLYSKGFWDIRKQRGLNSLVVGVFDSEGGFIEGSWMSLRNMQPGEWLNAREGSRKI